MSKPFYSVRCVAQTGEDMVARRTVYLIGPQFCGGEKHVIAHVFPETVLEVRGEHDRNWEELPAPVREFLKWCDENVTIPGVRK